MNAGYKVVSKSLFGNILMPQTENVGVYHASCCELKDKNFSTVGEGNLSMSTIQILTCFEEHPMGPTWVTLISDLEAGEETCLGRSSDLGWMVSGCRKEQEP